MSVYALSAIGKESRKIIHHPRKSPDRHRHNHLVPGLGYPTPSKIFRKNPFDLSATRYYITTNVAIGIYIRTNMLVNFLFDVITNVKNNVIYSVHYQRVYIGWFINLKRVSHKISQNFITSSNIDRFSQFFH